jgi:hypothetical protein
MGLLLAASSSVFAQNPGAAPEMTALPPANRRHRAFSPFRASRFSGDVPLTAAQISAVLDSFVGEGSLITLQQATGELENALKLAGYELHRVSCHLRIWAAWSNWRSFGFHWGRSPSRGTSGSQKPTFVPVCPN